MPEFEWDEAKDRANRVKHGISFEEAKTIWDGPLLTVQDERDPSEVREISFGLIGVATVLSVAHTARNGRIRLISARKATKSESQAFNAYLEETRR